MLSSDDWWETTEVLYSFEEEGTKDEYVQAIIVPDNGRIIAAIGGRGETGGKVELINEDLSGSETLYQFDYGRVSNSFGHVTYEDIVIIGSYKLSDFEGNRHANEVILSTDGGQSFEQILEPELITEDAPNLHIHDVEYDPYAERIWVTVGDSGNTQIYWSDDLGNSWETIGERGDPPSRRRSSHSRTASSSAPTALPKGSFAGSVTTPMTPRPIPVSSSGHTSLSISKSIRTRRGSGCSRVAAGTFAKTTDASSVSCLSGIPRCTPRRGNRSFWGASTGRTGTSSIGSRMKTSC